MAFRFIRDPAEGRLLLLTAILFISYLCVAISLPIVPVFVTGSLKLGNAWAGLAVGIAFLSTILTRGYAGGLADRRGAKLSVGCGLFWYAIGALASLASGLVIQTPAVAFLILLAGRLLLGLGESLVVVGVISWGIGVVGPSRSGRVLAFVGAANYGALAVGGPIGLVLLDHFGFAAAMALSAILPGIGLLAIWRLPAIMAQAGAKRPPFRSVVKRIWRHGLIICLQGIGFAAIGAFFALSFRAHGWSYAGLGLTAFGGGFVLVRIVLGHLPDRIGGHFVAIVSLAVETLGQMLIWSAATPVLALVGAFLTGLGCSLIFPAMGRELVRLVEPQIRSAALGGFAAFQDLAYGLTGPLMGLLADRAGYDSVFLVGGATAALGFVLAILLRMKQAPIAG
jgi:MFS family permease